MAYVISRDGRFTGMYRDITGRRVSAGTYNTEDEARAVASAMQAYVRGDSKSLDPIEKHNRTVAEFFPTFLRHHQVETNTKKGYVSEFHNHIEPIFGDMRIIDVERQHVRSWIVAMQEKGRSASTIRHTRACLSALMRMAADDGYRPDNPCTGVRGPKVTRRKINIMSPEEFDRIYKMLPNDSARVMLELEISTGMRYGELTEIRPRDFDGNILCISRAAADVGAKWSKDGQRFEVKTVKDEEWRHNYIDEFVMEAINALIDERALGPDDLMFSIDAIKSLDRYRMRGSKNFSRHLPRSDWRHIWLATLNAAGITWRPKAYELRHTHISWALDENVPPKEVMENVGHSDLSTTTLYAHPGKEVKKNAAAAISRRRGRAA